jgi:hypothetical protein
MEPLLHLKIRSQLSIYQYLTAQQTIFSAFASFLIVNVWGKRLGSTPELVYPSKPDALRTPLARLEAALFPRICPEGATFIHPRAKPWDGRTVKISSPERAIVQPD